MSEGLSLRWKAPGPVSAAFMSERAARVQAIMGPVGAAKTSTALMKLVFLAAEQKPSTRDGKRKLKACVVRDTYRQLWKTTIPSWLKWMPKTVGTWNGGDGEPARHEILFRLGDGTTVELIVEFIAIGENKVEDVLRGYEPTVFLLEEADLLVPEVLMYCIGRAGRYPMMNEGGPTWYGVLLTYNAPDMENYLYEIFEERRPNGFKLFRQPSGFSPDAENLENLPKDYYANLVEGQPDWYVRRMVRNEYGYTRGVELIYPEYNDALHVSAVPLVAVRGRALIIGLDGGMTPAGLINQQMPNGQWRLLREVVTPKGETMGPTRFSEVLNQVLKDEFGDWSRDDIAVAADPATQWGGDEKDLAWIDTVRKETKLKIRPAPSNVPTVRWEAVKKPLVRMIDGRDPGFLMDPSCKMMRRGFNQGYRFRVIDVTGTKRYHNTGEAEKNEFSHAHDGEQYALLTFSAGYDVSMRGAAERSQRRQETADLD